MHFHQDEHWSSGYSPIDGGEENENIPMSSPTDLPMGLGMRIAQDPVALEHFSALTAGQKTRLIAYVQAAQTGEDAIERIRHAISMLDRGQPL